MKRSPRIAAAIGCHYFDLSYRLLVGSPEGRQFLRESSPIPGTPVHGYATVDDLAAVSSHLGLRGGVHALDIGSGLGGPALALGRRTGAEITGIEPSPHAVRVASRRSIAADLHPRISFVEGSTHRLPRLGATGAYALDVLMFAPIDLDLLLEIHRVIGDGGRLVATVLAIGADRGDQLARIATASGMRVVDSRDVTASMVARSAERRRVARRLLAGRRHTVRGRLAMSLIVIEEGLVLRQVRLGRLRRWRTVVELARLG